MRRGLIADPAADFYMHSGYVIILLYIIRRKSSEFCLSSFLFRIFIILIIPYVIKI